MADARASTGESKLSHLLALVGRRGIPASKCGSVLATDQRYCLNCGRRRGERRLRLRAQAPAGGARADGGRCRGGPGAAPNAPQWTRSPRSARSPLLGVMLLLGVLIGKDNNNTQTVAAQAAPTTTAAAATPTDTTRDDRRAAPRRRKGGGTAPRPGERRPGRQRLDRGHPGGEHRTRRSSRTRRTDRTWSRRRASPRRSTPTDRPAEAAPRPASGADDGPGEETKQRPGFIETLRHVRQAAAGDREAASRVRPRGKGAGGSRSRRMPPERGRDRRTGRPARAARAARGAGHGSSPSSSGTSAAWPTRWRAATTTASTCSTSRRRGCRRSTPSSARSSAC